MFFCLPDTVTNNYGRLGAAGNFSRVGSLFASLTTSVANSVLVIIFPLVLGWPQFWEGNNSSIFQGL